MARAAGRGRAGRRRGCRGAPADERRYAVSDAHAAVLCDRDSLAYLTPFARMLSAAAVQMPRLLEAYRSGGGVGWSDYGELMRTAQAEANRPLFLEVLGAEWLPALPEVDAALRDGGKVADIGCGDGWSSIGIARAYPAVTVDGYDVDGDSITRRATTPRRTVSASASGSPRSTPPACRRQATTTWSPRSSASTTCPTRSACCARRGGWSGPAAPSW